ncbi:MAG TPA: hypothetical protein VL915_11640 [Gemmatimonadales bacterium]|nr:hypothetical protein [Gemmatimonadales bacterium]
MSRDALKTYLNDHLTGSVMAIELGERTIRENEGGPVAARLSPLMEQIREDQTVLKGVIERLGTGESSLKKAGAWLAEKAGRVKLGGTDEPGELSRLEVLEMLTTGVHGKRALWRALRVVAARYEELRGLDLDLLERRAVEQHDELEAMRLEAAKVAL